MNQSWQEIRPASTIIEQPSAQMTRTQTWVA
jgi:hypothetical protein